MAVSPAITNDSLVLVTGANGFIASHVVDQLLQSGFRVRGTVRSLDKGAWVQAHFDEKFGAGKLELAVVKDMVEPGAFTEAVKGAAAVIHLASNLSFHPDPNEVIPGVIKGLENIIAAANAEESVKNFVYTSSSSALVSPVPNTEFTLDVDTWNTESVKQAWAPPPYEDERKFIVYDASKTQAEQLLWKIVKEQKPHFVTNTVIPYVNFGPIINLEHQNYHSAMWPLDVYQGGSLLDEIPPQFHIDVRDTARLHVAPLLDASIISERIFAIADPFNQPQIRDIVKKLKPSATVRTEIADPGRDLSVIVPRERTEEILRKVYGRQGLVGLEESLEANLGFIPG